MLAAGPERAGRRRHRRTRPGCLTAASGTSGTTPTGTENIVIDPVKKTREDGGDAAGRRAGLAGGGGRGGRGGGGGGGGRGGAAAASRSRRPADPNVTGTTGPPPPSMSPDGSKALFICDWNLWVHDVATGQERQLTTDGVKDFGYATSNAGMGDERRAGAVVVARRQEDRDAAAGRAQGRRHVPGRDAGQRRPPGAPRLEVSAAGRSATSR